MRRCKRTALASLDLLREPALAATDATAERLGA
jgi:hypothetical protein